MQGYASKREVGGRRRFRRLSHILDMVLQELNEKKDSENSRWSSSNELEKPGGGRFNKLW